MELIVHGFPTKLQALQVNLTRFLFSRLSLMPEQFEWAWQNPQKSRHLQTPMTATKKAAQFPKTALSNKPLSKVQVLQYMISSKPWSAFNLRVTFFSQDAKAWWDRARQLGATIRTDAGVRKWQKQLLKDGSSTSDPWGSVRGARIDQVKVDLREHGVDGERLARAGQSDDIIDPIIAGDAAFADAHVAKWQSIAADEPRLTCPLCADEIDKADHLSFVMCPSSAACESVYHASCLAEHFVGSSSEPAALLPTKGFCPTCAEELHWQDLIKGSFRLLDESLGRRKKEKKPRRRKAASLQEEQPEEEEDEDASEDDDGLERSWALQVEADPLASDASSFTSEPDLPVSPVTKSRKEPAVKEVKGRKKRSPVLTAPAVVKRARGRPRKKVVEYVDLSE